MSQQQQQQSNNVPVSEVYWSFVKKADKKFSKIRDLPYYQRNRYDTYFFKVFKVYTRLWKFQQENRQKLVEAGVKRWEIGEIASRIAQLYFGQYMRTSETSYLAESYVFYEAIFTREYFKEGLLQDVNVTSKQLRFLARFLMVCLVLNRRQMVHRLIDQLKMLVDESKRVFQESDFKEWKVVVQQIIRFLKADTSFMNIRPLRYSLVLDPHPDSFPHITASVPQRNIKLTDAILTSCHHNEARFLELTLDTFRMLQCVEWEASGSFYQSNSSKTNQNGASGPSRSNFSTEIVDPTLPPNPRKAILYRPSATHFLAVLATICEELAPDGILLIYISASGRGGYSSLSSAGNCANTTHFTSQGDTSDSLGREDYTGQSTGCLQFGTHGIGGSIYPCDLLPFTRRPLFLIIDSDKSEAFEVISGAEKGEPAAVLLSPSLSPIPAAESPRQPTGSLFTIFLTAPLQAFCLLLGLSGSDVEMDTFEKAEKLLSSSFVEWGLTLATTDSLDPVWAQVLADPFLRRILLRFLFCQAVLTLYGPTFNKKEFHPSCKPCLPASALPTSDDIQTTILQVASIFGATKSFNFLEGIVLPEEDHSESEFYSP